MRTHLKPWLCLFAVLFTLLAPVCAHAQAKQPDSIYLTQERSVRKTTYEKKKVFSRFLSLAEPIFTIPGLNQAMIPQGMATGEDGTIYLSGYFKGSQASMLVVVSADGQLRAQYSLQNPDGSAFTGHVGGLAIVESCLYLSAGAVDSSLYQIARFPLTALVAEGAHMLRIDDLLPVPVSPSFLSGGNGLLWIGNF